MNKENIKKEVFPQHFHRDTVIPTFVKAESRRLPARKARAATADAIQNIIGMFGATAWK